MAMNTQYARKYYYQEVVEDVLGKESIDTLRQNLLASSYELSLFYIPTQTKERYCKVFCLNHKNNHVIDITGTVAILIDARIHTDYKAIVVPQHQQAVFVITEKLSKFLFETPEVVKHHWIE